MSTKLPVGETINEAFQFGLHRWGAVLRFGWLPVVVSMVVFLATALLIIDFSAFPAYDVELESSEELGDILRFPAPVAAIIGLAAYILVFLLMSGVLASIYRLAALGEDRPGVFQLRMDGPAKRVFFALIILALINLIVWVVSLNIGLSVRGSSWEELFSGFRHLVALPAATDSNGGALIGNEEALGWFQAYFYSSLIAIIPLIYVNVKLVPFVAGSAAENRLWLIGSFVKTTGHFWSLIGISILMVLLIIVIAIAFQLVMMIVQLLSVALIALGSGFTILGGILIFAIFPASIWYSGFVYALQFGVQGIIYRRLKTGD